MTWVLKTSHEAFSWILAGKSFHTTEPLYINDFFITFVLHSGIWTSRLLLAHKLMLLHSQAMVIELHRWSGALPWMLMDISGNPESIATSVPQIAFQIGPASFPHRFDVTDIALMLIRFGMLSGRWHCGSNIIVYVG